MLSVSHYIVGIGVSLVQTSFKGGFDGCTEVSFKRRGYQ